MINDRIDRISKLLNLYVTNKGLLKKASPGTKASIKRQQVFLKEKITYSLKEIQKEIQPKLFVAHLINHTGEEYTAIVSIESKEDLNKYLELLKIIKGEYYELVSIEPLGNLYKGCVNFISTK